MTPNAVFSRSALRDLEEIGLYIAKDNLTAADSLVDRIEKTCQSLAEQPEMGQLRPELGQSGYRSFSVGKYVIYYRETTDGIMVARILHGARDQGPLLKP